MYRHAGIDIFLTASRYGQGLGTEAIRLLARHLFEKRGHHRLTIDPAADNKSGRVSNALSTLGWRESSTWAARRCRGLRRSRS
jgi:hypothetical protein